MTMKEQMNELVGYIYMVSSSIMQFVNAMYSCGLTYKQACEYINEYVSDEWENEPIVQEALETIYGRS